MPNQSPTERELLIDVQLGNIQDAQNKLGAIVVKISELKKAYKELSDQEKQSVVTTGEYTKSINQLNADKTSLLKTLKDLAVAQRQENLNLKAADDSIIGMRGSLAALKDQYVRLGQAAREGIGGTDLLAKISKLNAEVSKAEQSMGVFSRNVGNYKSGFNGLSNSINQVAREMPNFAQSATIGFMALSNNLPILADEIQRVRQANALLVADGKPTVSVFKQIASSIFSWQSALITLISLSVVFSKELGNLFTGGKEVVLTFEELEKQIIKTTEVLDKFANQSRRVFGRITAPEEEYLNYLDSIERGLTDIDNKYKDLIATKLKEAGLTDTSPESKRNKITIPLEKAAEDEKTAFARQMEADRQQKVNAIYFEYQEKIKRANVESIKDDRQKDLKLNQLNQEFAISKVQKGTDNAKALQSIREYYRILESNINAEYDKKDEEEARKKREKHLKELQKQLEADAKYLSEEFDRAIEYSTEHYTDLESLVKQSYANGQLSKEQYEDELLKLERERMIDSIRLHTEYNKDLTKISAEAAKIEVGAIGKSQTGGKIDLVKPKGTFSPDISKQLKDKEDQEDKNRKLAIDAAINAAKETADAVAQIKQQGIDRQLKRELTAIQRNADKEDRILENRLKNGIISEGQYNDAKQKLNEETAAKELEANRTAFEQKKRLDTATAIANGALAITSILAQYPKFDYGIAAAIAIGAAVASTATQVAVIQSQKFALGGKVNGKSHAEGGVMIEAEGGEGMINKNSMRSTQVMQAVGTPSQIASAINMSGGGISWETGASINSPNRSMFNNMSESNTITYSQMAGLLNSHANSINSKKVVILESEITRTQNKVKNYETSGRF